ncbi:MAG: phytanoyl-CoA dioxygenase family protein [Pseudomonadota bacterium]|nr:phytanoyl-CoA dioxygenase family protein [Pseudomonadota bacterium]
MEVKTPVLTAQEHALGLKQYFDEGANRAQEIGNRGPLKLNKNGELEREILEAFEREGFYVFEGVVEPLELGDLRVEIDSLLERAPTGRYSRVDKFGRPAFGEGFKRGTYTFIKPLSDPWGGTDLLGGRHPVQMTQPLPSDDAPKETVHLIGGMCQIMKSGLRLYGHPSLLAVAEAINGKDFVPFNEAVFVKQPGLGGSVAWHQDGVTHWEAPNWDPGIHGFNFQVQLYDSTPANCLWVIPGSHRRGKADIKSMVAENDNSELLPEAIPMPCKAGDVTIANRQILHCSFANTSPDLRVAMTFGFHRRSSVLGARGALSQGADLVYDEKTVFERSRVIAVAIDARQQYFPNEKRYQYHPFIGLEDHYRWNEENYDKVIRDYNLQDLAI